MPYLTIHFEEIVPSEKAKCGYCSRVLGISASSIGSLSRHLKSVHPTIQLNSSRQPASFPETELLDRRVDSELGAEPVPSCSTNLPLSIPKRQLVPSMADHVFSKKTLPRNRIQQLDEQLVKMIAKGYHALRLVYEVEFRKFVEMLNPGYTLPTRKPFRRVYFLKFIIRF